MKRIKFLLALTLTVCMLLTVAFAADTLTVNDIEYSGSGNIVVTISSSYSSEYELGGQMTFDTTKLEFVESNSTGVRFFRGSVRIVGAALGSDITITLKPLVDDINDVQIKLNDLNISNTKTGVIQEEIGNKIVTITTSTPEPEKPVITKNETKGATVETETTIYTNIFKGEYSAKAASNVVISEIGIKYHATDVNDAKAEKLSKAVSVEGGATVNFKAAILGVAADTELVVEPYTVYAFAK